MDVDLRDIRDACQRAVDDLMPRRQAADRAEVAQEGMVRLWRVARSQKVQNLDALARVVVRRALDTWLRRHYRRSAIEVPHATAGAPDPAATESIDAMSPEDVSLIRVLVVELFEEEHPPCAALARAYFSSESWEAVARSGHEKPGAVRARWMRCVGRLKRAIDEGRLPTLERFRRFL